LAVGRVQGEPSRIERMVPSHGSYCGPSRDGRIDYKRQMCVRPGPAVPIDQTDAACKRHDEAYARQGMTMFTPPFDPRRQAADRQFIRDLQRARVRSPGEAAYNAGAQVTFGGIHAADRAVLPPSGIIPLLPR
jgi:hypothetical protein